ncbi:hypothetical protein BJY52DRAFT_840654 [Lactarius psammicola]|nr:hypothetical protein BJY52DRAFT_840654 [Lactarius psammicola]
MLARRDTVKADNLKVTLDTSRWRNALLPSHVAFLLPLELLQNIFLILVDLYLAREFPHSSRRPNWIAITYVCRYWRSAALGLPELWTSITPRLSISWSRAMTKRSSPLPMRINMQIGAFFSDGVESLVASELLPPASRIRTLRLSGYPVDVLKVLNRLCSPSPLESLSLWVTGMGERVELPEALCDRDTPHLRSLTFETPSCFRAPVWLLAGITHFTTSADVSLHELLGTLQAMPQLEVLCIARILNEWDASEQVPLPHAVLPRLSRLSFHDNTPHRLVVLSSRIDAPPTLRRHLFWRAWLIPGWQHWASMFTAVQAFVPRDSSPGIDDGGLRFAQITGGYEYGSFEVWSRTGTETATADAGVFAHEDALFLFRIDWQGVVALADDAEGPLDEFRPFFQLASLCAHLRTARIVDLVAGSEASSAIEREADVQDAPDAPDVVAQWHALLYALPSVKTLRLYHGSPACLSILRAFSASAGLLPHLQKIFVVQSTVRYAADSVARQGDIGDADADAGSAVACRKPVQANMGAELVEAVSGRSGLEVVLAGCEVDEEALDALQKRARVCIGHERVYV